MIDKKYTDKDIISSLEVIATTCNCNECKIRSGKWGTCNCSETTANAALDLINHQKAEIERLQKEVNLISIQFQDLQERYEEAQTEIERLKGYPYATLVEVSKKLESQIKSEAVKEFVERLKDIYKVHDGLHLTINNLVKEMVGDNNESV